MVWKRGWVALLSSWVSFYGEPEEGYWIEEVAAGLQVLGGGMKV
jgi:hypothetical protein